MKQACVTSHLSTLTLFLDALGHSALFFALGDDGDYGYDTGLYQKNPCLRPRTAVLLDPAGLPTSSLDEAHPLIEVLLLG